MFYLPLKGWKLPDKKWQMRKYLVIASLLLAPSLSAQTLQMQQENHLKIDSMIKVLPSLNDSARVDCLNALFLPYKRTGKNDSAVFYTTQAYNEAKKIKYIRGIAEALSNKAATESFFNGNCPAGEKLAREALDWYEKTPNKGGIAWAYYNLGWTLCSQSFFQEANKNYEKAYYWYQKTGNELGMFSTLTSWGCNYEESGDFEKGFEHKRQGLELAYKINNDLLIRNGLRLVAESFKLIEDYPSAINYYRQGFKKTAPEERDVWTYVDFAILFIGQRQYDSALYYLNLVDTSKVDEGGLQFYRMIKGEYYLSQKAYDKALPYFGRALNDYNPNIDQNRAMRMLLDISKTYVALQNTDSALYYVRKGLSLGPLAWDKKLNYEGFYILYEVYDKLHQSDSSFFYYRQYIALKDAILTDQIKRRLFAYTYEQKIELLNKEKQIQQANLEKESFLKEMLITGILILLILSVFIFRYIMLKRKNERHQREIVENELQIQKLESERTKAELQQQATELEMQALRAQMNPHFIFNCLSSINGFILKNESEPASDYLTKFSRLIRMVLTNSKKAFITLGDELEMLKLYLEMERLRFQYSFEYNISFKNEIDCENIFIPPLLLQPFAENAIWHGLMQKEGHGHLEIELSLENKLLTCVITDNGIGRNKAALMKSKSAAQQKSMGLQITTERLALLNQGMKAQTFFNIEDITDEKGTAAGTRVILKMNYRDLAEAIV
jgi:tetratricopeptide (TPR) repeat protein